VVGSVTLATDLVCQSIEISCRDELLNADTVEALQARGVIRKAEAKWPGLTNYLGCLPDLCRFLQ
jgi:hypothetical protein